jgi:hypothetical protein
MKSAKGKIKGIQEPDCEPEPLQEMQYRFRAGGKGSLEYF